MPPRDGAFTGAARQRLLRLARHDATATSHGPIDTRHTNPRCRPLQIAGADVGHIRGLGQGTMQFFVDPMTGAPAVFAWTVATAPMATTIAIGRASS